MNKEVVLITCADRPGLIHQITGVLFNHKLNITETQEFVDHGGERFFMRIQFEGTTDSSQIQRELIKILPDGAFCQVRRLQPRNVLIFVSKEPHCLGDLLLRHATGELSAVIQGVVSQHEDCKSLAGRFGLPFHYVPVGKLTREQHEEEIIKIVNRLQPDYLILARYMRIFTRSFTEKFAGRVLNIHHSFLPAFIGKNPYEQAYERGVKIIGATAHFVTQDLDEGPIITQSVIQVNHAADPQEMARQGQDVEKIVLARATELILEDRVVVDRKRTIVFD